MLQHIAEAYITAFMPAFAVGVFLGYVLGADIRMFTLRNLYVLGGVFWFSVPWAIYHVGESYALTSIWFYLQIVATIVGSTVVSFFGILISFLVSLAIDENRREAECEARERERNRVPRF